ncbi:hypothetical protein BH09ACT8_BH09ACT8_57970 [soil metagenome]
MALGLGRAAAKWATAEQPGRWALPALNAFAAVVAAPPGLLSSADLLLRGFAGRFAL